MFNPCYLMLGLMLSVTASKIDPYTAKEDQYRQPQRFATKV